jgi:hypothetical protein
MVPTIAHTIAMTQDFSMIPTHLARHGSIAFNRVISPFTIALVDGAALEDHTIIRQ